MNLESTREFCLSLPHATEMIQWENHLLFKVGGKMFAIASLEPDKNVLSFKASPDDFYSLQEMEGLTPAPYMARAQWLALERWDALRDDELRHYLAESYRMIYEKLTKKVKAALEAEPAKKPAKKKAAKKR